MAIVYIGAGLANRMFQYAFALSIKKRGIDVYIDEHSFKPRYDFEDTRLSNVFNNIELNESKLDQFKYVLSKNLVAKIYRKISYYFPDYRYIERWKLDYDPQIYNKITKHCILVGFWISPKYFVEIDDEIRKAFVFKGFELQENRTIASKLQKENSVAVHFRKNIDYLRIPKCGVDYYKQAIQIIKDKVDNPKFYFFSDNWDWVRENIADIEYTAIDWNSPSGKDSHCDMQLMSYCKHNIIANSTYSWWGAWLNTNPDKIIISPEIWFDGLMKDNSVVLPESWIKI